MTSPIGAVGMAGGLGGVAGMAGVGDMAGMAGVGGVSGVLPAGTAQGAQGASGNFAAVMARGLDQVQGLQSTADTLAVQAATGDLKDVHNYMLASTQAQLATEMTVALRNKAVDAFTEIMRMQG